MSSSKYLPFSTDRGPGAGGSSLAWPLLSTMAHERGWGGQSHTIMLVIDMSDTAPASNTDTGSSEDKL